jgi:tRNA nucleotidyltransferase (CCA-adding enzyme)
MLNSWEDMRNATGDDYLGHLAGPARQLLDSVAAEAHAHGLMPYLVGGSVRDLILGRTTVDLDIVVVGEALLLARAVHDAVGGEQVARLHLHEAFGTATLLFADGLHVDLITARHERYPAPGALPVVTPGTIDQDLRRRDFTINALALRLEPDGSATLLDPLGGRADLSRGLLRVLHAASFNDDPTRLLRGLRYAGRLGYFFAPDTDVLCRAALSGGALRTVSIQRVSHELIRIFEEARAAAIFELAAGYGLFSALPVTLCWDAATRQAFPRLDTHWHTLPAANRFARWEARFALLVVRLPPAEARALAARLSLPSGATLLAAQVAQLRELLAATALPATDAAIGRLLDTFVPAAIVAFAAWGDDEDVRTALLRYLRDIRPLTPVLTGDTLRALGVPPGPIYREALAALRDQKRNNPAVTVEDERAFLLSWLAVRGVAIAR